MGIIRAVKVINTNEKLLVSDEFFNEHKDEFELQVAYANMEVCMQNMPQELSDGECLDLATKLYDEGVAQL